MNHLSSKHTWTLFALFAALLANPLGCRGIIGVEEKELIDRVGCQNYCDIVQAQCTGDNVQYASNDACLAMCETFEVGTIDDTEKNTLGCRVRVLETIAENKEVNLCRGLGPSGGGLCGSDCESYCRGLEQLCKTQFDTFEGECLSKCQSFSACGGYVAVADRNDDSLQCRIFHLTSAALDSETHCKHAIADGHCFEATQACPTTP